MFIDIHCHLDWDPLQEKIDQIHNEMKQKNIVAWTNTLNPENYEKNKILFKNYENIKICAGLYPQDAEKIDEKQFQKYLKQIQKDKNQIAGIGEVGLDYHNTKDENLKQIQEQKFRQLIDLAIKLDKPMLIHTRKAEQKILQILEEYRQKHPKYTKFCLHCFMGKKKYIQKIIALKLYCSIPAILKTTESFQILVKQLPIKQILVETDSPFLHPEKKLNDPTIVPQTYELIADIKGYDKKEIENIIYRNYINFTM